MLINAKRSLQSLVGLSLTLGALVVTPAASMAQKDPPHEPSQCDKFKKGSADWRKCVGQVRPDLSDNELFYAGYWLARVGRYGEALGYLERTKVKDARTLTYIGFALRKLGRDDEARRHYTAALDLDPRYTVARQYLGEAHVERGDIAAARAELEAIRTICGETCTDYVELAKLIGAGAGHTHVGGNG
jgi:tetratricopeptide (TPR) repeat protein